MDNNERYRRIATAKIVLNECSRRGAGVVPVATIALIENYVTSLEAGLAPEAVNAINQAVFELIQDRAENRLRLLN